MPTAFARVDLRVGEIFSIGKTALKPPILGPLPANPSIESAWLLFASQTFFAIGKAELRFFVVVNRFFSNFFLFFVIIFLILFF